MAGTSSARTRRVFLKAGGAVAAVAFAQTLQARQNQQLKCVQAGPACGSASLLVESAYGPIAPVADMTTGLPLLQLPNGFHYVSYGWTGDPMSDGRACPGSHDGMGVVQSERGGRFGRGRGRELVLVRNHERGLGVNPIAAPSIYDAGKDLVGQSAEGGTTNLVFDAKEFRFLSMSPSLGGTLVNCAGGVTPWSTWLTCEEIATDITLSEGKKHGYVFEVRPQAAETTGRPIVEMGRFSHEAAAVDPDSGFVYLTEDARNISTLYRFIPNEPEGEPGSLERGGKLQAARVVGVSNASLINPRLCDTYPLDWVDIDNPDQNLTPVTGVPGTSGVALTSGCFAQAWAKGALQMSRGEGIWYFDGKLFIVDTSAGVAADGRLGRGDGCVWELDLEAMALKAVFVSQNPVVGNNPDNIGISPRGGILLCEDGGGVTDSFGFGDRMMGLNTDGSSFIFAKNNINLSAADVAGAGKLVAAGDYRGREFCGATWDPSGRILFVNVQTPGITFAITGPWRKGSL
jgi:secreted PhoX family phosphatase